MSIDAKLVAELRKRTGLPLMKCKAALVEANGDIEAAAVNLRKQGVKAAEKVADRELKEGLVFVHRDGNGACAVSLLCQTDFVAKSEDVQAFGNTLVQDLYDHAPADRGAGADLLQYKMQDGTVIEEQYKDFALKIRENIQIGQYARFRPEKGAVFTYVHHNGRIAALVEFEGENLAGNDAVQELGNDLGMQLSFHKDVQALTRDQLDAAWVAQEREVFAAQSQKLPENKRDQIIEGKLSKRLQDVVLLEQPFIKNDKVNVQQRIDEVAKAAGVAITLTRFARIGAGA